MLVPQAGYALIPPSIASPHFNSRGELIQPSPPLAPAKPPPRPISNFPPTHAMRPRHNIRLCARHGCAAILPQKDPSHICLRCRNLPSRPSHQLHRIPRHPISPITTQSLPLGICEIPVDKTPIVPSNGVTSLTHTVVDDIPDDDLDDLQLQYPEPEEVASSASQPSPKPSPRTPAPTPGIRLRIPAPSHPSKVVNPADLPAPPSGSQVRVIVPPPANSISPDNSYPQWISVAPNSANPGLKKLPPSRRAQSRPCASPGCDGFLQTDSTGSRCPRCVMKDWKSRFQGEGGSSNKRRKTVTWADETTRVGSTGEEGPVNNEADGDGLSPRPEERCAPRIKIRISPARRSSLSHPDTPICASPAPSIGAEDPAASHTKLEGEPEAVPSGVDPQFSTDVGPLSDAPTSPEPEAVRPAQEARTSAVPASTAPAAEKASPTEPEDAMVPSPLGTQSSPGPSLTAPTELGPFATIPGWDSDLTDLSDLCDHVESEIDASSSDEEPSAQHRTTGLKIRIPARPKPPPLSERAAEAERLAVCTIKRCQRVLPKGYRWKCCVPCRLHHREYQRKRQGIQGRHTHLDHEVDGYHDNDFAPRTTLAWKPEALLLTPGARLCSIKKCTHVIPAREEYKWKMCEPCRIRTRNYSNRRRKMAAGAEGSGADHLREQDDAAAAGGSGSESEDIPLSVTTAENRAADGSSTGLRRCMSQDCGMWVDPTSSQALCTQCSMRRVRNKRSRPRKDAGDRDQVRKPADYTPYPEYKSWTALLDDFHARLVGFLEAQSCYFRYEHSPKAAEAGKGRVQSTFGFDGEFSVVALDFDVLGRKDAVHRTTAHAASEIARVGGFEFDPTAWVSTPNRSIVTRFACVYNPSKASEALDLSVPAVRQMHGELEIAVLPDHTHMLFPGQRTIVRFRLAG
ncbi:hypothetical protein LshimejAT787_1205010 [Lyophyllum shimeji]|uniref:Uncharacterized protein n=1 Tax=Lyophyllum shimeji TaxID=47721 RepID=A0A9P3PXH3_LYOSH|nr:hypothetical protein LshimejAT787_1205010 [Lyophyllum shimeji]